MTAATGYWPCRRCGMTFSLAPPELMRGQHREKLVCSECHLAYGVATNLPPRKGRRSVYCWLIRAGDVRNMKGAKKIA